ncbi:MAG: sulfatase-like hydrolase/transferase, partial [Muribaculaceae bacterium]|nr:sulfatase-like hydrolase/transferase [Muribaculaceae bacterium]
MPFSALYGFPTAFSIAYVVSVGAFKAVLLCSICMLVSRSHVIVKVLWRVMLFLYVALSLTNCLSFVLYGFGISRRLFIIIAQTNPIELREFMPDLADNIMAMCRNVGLWIAVALAAGALAVTVRHTKAKTFITLAGVMSTIGAVALAWLMLTFKYGRLSNFMCLRAPQYLNETLQTKRAYDMLADRLLPFPDPDLVESERLPVNIVMVIGESASRNHHSLYGYELPTTPRLDSIREQLTIFTDAIGSSCGTVGNMERILTFKDDDLTCNDWYKFPGIIDLFKNAGYKTYYLSNQEKMGLTCDAFGAMAATADVVTYAGVLVREDALSYKHDDVLLPEIRKALNDSTAGYRFIIAHL